MPKYDRVRGRYIYLPLEGTEYRVYFEESGSGIPLLLQHTAGADSRQWRHLLEDEEVTRHFRLIAYDLPYHGKSLPPPGREWWREEYRLERGFLMQVPLTLAQELELDRPVYMGSSIGGHLALDLAHDHPDRFRAVIALEAAMHTPGGYVDLFYHPRLSNDFKASLMYGLMAPQSPEAFRRETAWVYSQGAPAVFKGDLYYYSVEHDLRESLSEIDTERVAVYVLNGEYDWSSTPGHAEAIQAALPGARCQIMEGLGHFPMSENPARFRRYLLPLLEEIRTRS